MKKIALVGSTGSIGRQVIKVAARYPDKFRIVAMSANCPSELFESQLAAVKPEFSALASRDAGAALYTAAYPSADIVFNAAGGFAGLEYSLAAAEAGKTLALANKESLVCGGGILMPAAQKRGTEIIPVDSEHSAIWQCLNFNKNRRLRRLIITASGGAFRGKSAAELKNVTPAQALAHPTWQMGAKITVDSATLINKGYEVIEAHMLYGTPYCDIETVIQPASIVHSMVEFDDGAYLAQLGNPTMEVPIQLALTYPERLPCGVEPLDFKKAFLLAFEPLERKKYPLFDLALNAAERENAPCVLNAADEVAVEAFLRGQIGFTQIYDVVEKTLSRLDAPDCADFAALKELDGAARACAVEVVNGIKAR